MNWYTLQVNYKDRAAVAYVNAIDALTAIKETKETYKVQGVAVSITARKALYKEWNHYNRNIKGDLI